MPPMKAKIAYWTSVVREAERELEAATTVAEMKAAAPKLMGAKVKLRRLQTEVTTVEA
jgi:hypothetical protein